MKKVSKILKKYQQENQYTYQKTAETLNMSKSTVYAYIHNTRNPSVKSVQKLAKSLKISPLSLLDEFGENTLEEQFLKELKKHQALYHTLMKSPKEYIQKIEQFI